MTTALTDLLEKKIPRKFVQVGLELEMVFFIGDIHGCYEEFVELCEKCRAYASSHGETAKIIQLGDLIDRGPYFFKIFQYINEHDDVMFVNGNHEYNFFIECTTGKACRSRARLVSHGKFSFLKDDEKELVLSMIASAPLGVYGWTESAGSYMATHAPPNGIEYFARPSGKHCSLLGGAFNSFSRSTLVEPEILHKKHGVIDGCSHTVYHGHQNWSYADIKEQMKDQESNAVSIFNLDSGCVYGGSLTAICADTKAVLSVNAKKTYYNK